MLADTFRDIPSAKVLAEQAGLDVSVLDVGNTVAGAWHVILKAAETDGLLDNLAARTIERHPRSTYLKHLWEDYMRSPGGEASYVDVQARPRASDGDTVRIDQLQRDLSDTRASLQKDLYDARVQVAGLIVQVTTLTNTVAEQSKQIGELTTAVRKLSAAQERGPYLTAKQFATLLLLVLTLSLVVYTSVYISRDRPIPATLNGVIPPLAQ